MNLTTGFDVTKTASTVTKVATVTFVPKTEGTTQISFDSANTQVYSLGTSDAPTENVLSTTRPANLTIGTGACLNGPTGSVSPSPVVPSETPEVTPTGAIQPTTAEISPTPTTVANQLPVCSSLAVNPSASGAAPLSILFTGQGNDPDTSVLITKATFVFGDGQTQDVTSGLNQQNANVQANHTYNDGGTFTANMILTDDQGGLSQTSEACSQTITVTAASGSATLTPTSAPTVAPTVVEKPTATPTLVEKPTIAPTGNVVQTMGTITLVIISLVGGFILLAL
jgi:hypothetical protein